MVTVTLEDAKAAPDLHRDTHGKELRPGDRAPSEGDPAVRVEPEDAGSPRGHVPVVNLTGNLSPRTNQGQSPPRLLAAVVVVVEVVVVMVVTGGCVEVAWWPLVKQSKKLIQSHCCGGKVHDSCSKNK